MFKHFSKFKICVFICCLVPAVGNSYADEATFYDAIEKHVFENGATVYLASDKRSQNISLEFEFKAGFAQETDKTREVMHLLEHALFLHPSLPLGTSFLDYVKESGGETNGHTRNDSTVYDTKISIDKIDFILDIYEKMFIGRTFDNLDIELARKPVVIERGRPSHFLSYILGNLVPLEFKGRGLFEYFFHLPRKKYHNDDEFQPEEIAPLRAYQVNLLNLTKSNLQQAYDTYYGPQNLIVRVAGNFDKGLVLDRISRSFGTISKRGVTTTLIKSEPKALEQYYEENSLSDKTEALIVHRLHTTDYVNELIGEMYLYHLSHQFLKEIRNRSGDSYSVSYANRMRGNFGFLGLRLDSEPETVSVYAHEIEDKILNEAGRGAVSIADFEGAKSLYLRASDNFNFDSGSLMGVIHGKERLLDVYGFKEDPDRFVERLSYDEYNRHLRNIFKKELLAIIVTKKSFLKSAPEYLQSAVLLPVVFALFFLTRRPFAVHEIRYVKKIKFSMTGLTFLYLVTIALISLVNYGFYVIEYDKLLEIFGISKIDWLHELLDKPLRTMVCGAVLLGLSLFAPRKLMVVGDKLYFKSLCFYSRIHNLSDVEAIEVLRPWRLVKRLNWKLRLQHLSVWQRGLYIRFEGGRAYYIRTRDVEGTCKFLNDAVAKANRDSHERGELDRVSRDALPVVADKAS